jgi:hypothetical protein
MIVFIINGKPTVGKDTFVSMVDKAYYYIKPNSLVTNISTVDRIKKAAGLLGWNGEKTPEARKFLADLKALSTEYNDFPTMYCCDYAEKNKDMFDILFIHCREPENITNIKNRILNISRIPCYTLQVVREDVEEVTSNTADMNTDNYDYDIVVDNNGTINDLYNLAEYFVRFFIKNGPIDSKLTTGPFSYRRVFYMKGGKPDDTYVVV